MIQKKHLYEFRKCFSQIKIMNYVCKNICVVIILILFNVEIYLFYLIGIL